MGERYLVNKIEKQKIIIKPFSTVCYVYKLLWRNEKRKSKKKTKYVCKIMFDYFENIPQISIRYLSIPFIIFLLMFLCFGVHLLYIKSKFKLKFCQALLLVLRQWKDNNEWSEGRNKCNSSTTNNVNLECTDLFEFNTFFWVKGQLSILLQMMWLISGKAFLVSSEVESFV